jgi:hypothetical protein
VAEDIPDLLIGNAGASMAKTPKPGSRDEFSPAFGVAALFASIERKVATSGKEYVMALESADWIPELVETNPIGNDPVSQGDDHIRMLKRILKDTFPFANRTVHLPLDHLIHDDILLDASHDQQLIRCDTDSNAITVTLPLGSNVWSGYWVLIKKIRENHSLFISTSGGESLNGGPTITLTNDESWALVWSSGSTAWTGAIAFAALTADMIPNDCHIVLADMSEARVKGRAAGAGLDPERFQQPPDCAAGYFLNLKGLTPGNDSRSV